ncbi:hypothetical protein EPVG_00418 [Emiliania huxleyi virus 201]|nr:hypothetical protein ELVG_00452 [Emiliania huxleyi virus 203]AEP15827.1 hypothetical protein EQVG_00418 [Emiliania huxleyi virus 207]AEP16227.1 hypothetical protein ERVG_00352 [Emiliania huxleyi virus 208]AET98305.1 hypothetical protein EPVG_00418 [Emiliania huxleyi virus 201]
MATATTAQDNVENIQAIHVDIAPPPGQSASEATMAEMAASLEETDAQRKQVLIDLVAEISNALVGFGQTIKYIDQRIKNKQAPKTSKKCIKALKCIQKALQKSIYKDPNVYKNLSKPDGNWRDEYTTKHTTLYENIKECMKSNFDYTTEDNQLLFDFRQICLQLKIDGKEIITDADATAIERLINALNNIETEYIESSIELLQIMAMASGDSENGIKSMAYLMQWSTLWKTLLFAGGIGACIGLQSVLEPALITSNRAAGLYFEGGIDPYKKETIYYVFDTATKQFKKVIGELPLGARGITCPENIGYAFFSGISNSPYTFSPYICTAGKIVMYMPWLNVVRDMLHTTLTMPARLLPYLETMPITTNYAVAGVVAVAGMIGIGFNAHTYFKKRKRPNELEEIVTTGLSEGTAVAQQLAASQAQASSSTNRQQSKRPRVARS